MSRNTKTLIVFVGLIVFMGCVGFATLTWPEATGYVLAAVVAIGALWWFAHDIVRVWWR